MTPIAYAYRCQRIVAIGCLACRRRGFYATPHVHHLNLGSHAGQKRLGNEATIGLCPWHHVGEPFDGWTLGEMAGFWGPSLKHEPIRFHQVYGTDEQLLAEQNRLVDEKRSLVVGRIRHVDRTPSLVDAPADQAPAPAHAPRELGSGVGDVQGELS